MKKCYPLALTCILFLILSLKGYSQKPSKSIIFRNGSINTTENIFNTGFSKGSLRSSLFNKKNYLLIQFSQLPDSLKRAELSHAGISLGEYFPGNAFYAELPDSMNPADLKRYNVSAAYTIAKELKLSPDLQKKILKTNFKTVPDQPVAVGYYGSMPIGDVKASLINAGAAIVTSKFNAPNIIFIDADSKALKAIADLPFVYYLNQEIFKDVALNYITRGVHALDALSAVSGRNLQGKGVTVGVGDDANPSTHIDFTGRLIIRTPDTVKPHGTHTTGTVAGGGILNPLNMGMAPKATIVSKSFSDVLVDAPVYIADYNMVITSNSYASSANGCPGDGEYTPSSYYCDNQLNTYPALMHVFAAGNDGQGNCSPYVKPYSTVKSGFQCAKNVLTVGNLNAYSGIATFNSSAGPLDDGRIKPEIVAAGFNVLSTYPNNNFGLLSGTSQSAPAVSGTAALLYERFRQIYGGNPPGALIKAILCNSATDTGRPGPDYVYGFGVLNARKAVECVENGTFVTNTISNGQTLSYTLPISANLHHVKIMLYWSDPATLSFSPFALINNLDLKVTDPSSGVHLPLVLNPAAGNVTDNATEMVDNLNNIEQVTLSTPSSGDYTLTITGANIPLGPQRFYLVYETTEPSVIVEYPFGNETLVPGTQEYIRWNINGGDGNTFTAEYSDDNGSSWTLIDNNIPANAKSLPWTVPVTPGIAYRVRVTRNTTTYTDMSDFPFTVLGQPVLSPVTNLCPGYVNLQWNAIAGATGYDVMMLIGDSMQTIASTSSLSYLVPGLDKNRTYWFAIRAVSGISPGRRSIAVAVTPSGGSCSLSNFDNDYSIDSIPSPLTGRMYTSSQLGTTEDIAITLKNLGSVPSSGTIDVNYQVNGGAVVSESILTPVAAHSSLNYTFTAKHNFSVPGIYIIKTWVNYPGDAYHINDTLTTVIKQLQNAPITLSPSFTESFESALPGNYNIRTRGMDGLDRCDFNTSNSNGRARTFINTGFARTGNRCITLDQILQTNLTSNDSLITTFNLSAYTLSDNILFNFYYKNHGINFSLPGNKIWIRGSETSPWISAFTLPVSTSDIGGYRSSSYINVTELLAGAGQNFSSSFQVIFGESGYKSANSPDAPGANFDNGFSFDDISFTLTQNDLSVSAVSQPVINGVCNLSAAETIVVKVKNSGSLTLTNIPVRYSINGVIISETISSIAPNTTIDYTFSAPVDLSVYKPYLFKAWTDYSGDTYHSNDSTILSFRTSPLISIYPYLEDFESSDGSWFTGGINSSWAWGSPSKPIISNTISGTKAWVTGLTTDYNDGEYSFLYSPCFNLSSLTNPTLAFGHIFKTEDACNCDKHWAEYTTDDVNWVKLGESGSGQYWYDDATAQAWKISRPAWHQSIISIPSNASKIKFRIVMSSDDGVTYDGVGIDNIRVFDSSASTLPLTLLSFKAVRINENGLLTWETSREVNTEQFIVQKSMDAAEFTTIGSVYASGAASGNYNFTDYDLQHGISYYRLKMTDKDGRFKYSPVRTINFEEDGLTISIHPNPIVKDLLNIRSTSDCREIRLSDVSGRTVKTFNVKGLNHSLSVNDIEKGTYFVTIVTSKGKVTRKVIIE